MTNKNLFSSAIIPQIKSAGEAKIVQPVHVGQAKAQNELVFFIKPELLNVKDDQKILNSLQLIKAKFSEFEVEVNGTAIVPGALLKKFEIMNRHYGFINQLSRMASEIVDDDTRAQLFEMLEKEDTGKHQIFGGHELLKAFEMDVATLSEIWFDQEAQKLRSGFYFIEDTIEGKPIILVNGFHPSQLMHFTREDHRIYLMLLHTDTDWYDLKFDLVGDTFPERAKASSIRGKLYAEPERYGQQEVSINTNGVHLSAGPFEAAFEVVNFFGQLLDIDPEKTPPLAIQHAIQTGIPKEKALDLLHNPTLNESDLFSDTENLNTAAAVKIAKDWLEEK